MYGTLSTAVWILLVSSSVLGYYAYHLVDDLSALDLESAGQCTPSGVVAFSKSPKPIPTASPTDDSPIRLAMDDIDIALPLRKIQAPSGMIEGERASPNTDSDEPASIATIKYLHTGWIHARTLARLADWLRWIGKAVAIVNAIGIIANSVFQYASVYTNCYCDSSVYSWGISSAFNVINPVADDIELARKAWIWALALASTCCAFFVGTIYLVRDSLPC